MTKNEFLNLVTTLVVQENEKRGNPLFSSVVIAQAILETGWRTKFDDDKCKSYFRDKGFFGLERKSI